MNATSRLHSTSMRKGARAAVFVLLALLITLLAGPTPRADAVNVVGVEVHNNITYYVPDTPTVNGNKLDLYVPVVPGKRKRAAADLVIRLRLAERQRQSRSGSDCGCLQPVRLRRGRCQRSLQRPGEVPGAAPRHPGGHPLAP